MVRTLSLAVLLAFVPALAAQRTWTVAPTGGDFTEIRDAMPVVQHGDTVLVRAGTYLHFVLTKGIRLVGDPGATVRNGSIDNAVTVRNVPAGTTTVIAGFLGTMGLKVENCAGHVHLERLGPLDYASSEVSQGIQDCAQVTVDDVRIQEWFTIANSHVVMTRCTVASLDQALTVLGGDVTIVDSTLGLANNRAAQAGLHVGHANFGPTAVRLTGDSMRVVATGGPASQPAPAIAAVSATIFVDPQVVLVPAFGAPPIGGNATVTTLPLPSLTGSLQAAALDLRVRAPGATDAFTFLGLVAQPPVSTHLGSWWVGAGLVLIDAGPLAGGVRAVSLPVPSGLPRGLTFATQSLVALPSGPGLSNAQVVAVR